MKTQTLPIILGIMILISLTSVQALVIDSVQMNPEEIVPGETSRIKLGIENNGESNIEDISVVLDLSLVPFAPYDSASEFGIESLNEGKTKYVEFEVIALSDAESGIYKIPVKISYRYEGEEMIKNKDSLISMTVNSAPIMGVSFEEGLLLKSKENELDIKIINKGLSDVKFLEIEVDTSTYYTLLSSENIYIGDVDSDDFDSAEFKIYFKENSPTNINLPVVITYKDSLNKEYTEEFDIGLKVYTENQAIELGLMKRNNTTLYAGIIIVLILIWFIYRKWKKSRKMRKIKKEGY